MVVNRDVRSNDSRQESIAGLSRLCVFCSGSYVAGMEIMALEVLRGLRGLGIEVHCVTNAWNNGDFHSRLTEAQIPYTSVRLGKLTFVPSKWNWTVDALRYLPGARSEVRNLLSGFRPQAVLAYNMDAILMLGRVLDSYPIVLHAHEVPSLTLARRLLLPRIRSRIDACAVVSQYVADSYRKSGFAGVRVVYNGLEYPPRPTGGDASPEPDKGDVTRIGIVGQVGDWKGHADVIDALAHFKRASKAQVRLHVFGTGEPSVLQAYQKRAHGSGVDDAIEWHGFVSNRDEIYPLLDVVLVPSRAEDPAPLAAVEAGFYGLPTIATRKGGLPEIVEHGTTGLLVEAERPDQLAKGIQHFVERPMERLRMGSNARDRTTKMFARDRMIAELNAILQQVAVTRHLRD
jgi:glycosyltransferase involved in cell wall biosynthesis